jgi:competence protein ComFC
MSNNGFIKQALSDALEIIFPGICLICGTKLLYNSRPFYLICNKCLKKMEYIGGQRCRICSRELISEIEICTRCRNTDYRFDSNISLFEYRDEIKELIYHYKFKKRIRTALIFSDMLSEVIKKIALPVIPVPSASKKGHVHRLANELKKRHKAVIIDCLKRKGTSQQKELDFYERFKNLKGKIIADKKKISSLESAVLLDDIITTGATLNECACVLKENGVKKVYAVTIAIDL